MKIAARPVYFPDEEPASGRLFGLYNPPGGYPSGTAILICPPMGSEMMRSFRALRELAAHLSSRGIAVFHADYHGTGNSAGRDEDPGRVQSWLQSIDFAVEELKRLARPERLGILGLRIGGLLAALSAAKRRDIDFMVLWAACRSGKSYLRELRMMRVSESKSAAREADAAAAANESEEAGGFLITRETSEHLGRLDLDSLPAAPARRVLIVAREDMPRDERLVKALAKTGAEVTSEQWAGFVDMMQIPHRSVPPVELFPKIARWIDPDAQSKETPAALCEASTTISDLGVTVRETAFGFDSELGLFGVLTQPNDPSVRPRAALLLTTTGANYHVGPNRLYARLARQWATSGFDVMRMDFSGIGQSELRPGATVNAPYTEFGVADLTSGLRELRRRSRAPHFVIVGLCSGGYMAYHASLRGLACDGQILINPPLYYKLGDELNEDMGTDFEEVQRYKSSLLNLEKWKKLLTGNVEYRALARLALRRGREVAATRAKTLAKDLGLWRPAQDVGRDLRSLVDSARLLLVFADGDAGLDHLRRVAPTDLKRLSRRENFGLAVIPRANHTFSDLQAQARLSELLTAHLLSVWS